jgi:hypothetical protein
MKYTFTFEDSNQILVETLMDLSQLFQADCKIGQVLLVETDSPKMANMIGALIDSQRITETLVETPPAIETVVKQPEAQTKVCKFCGTPVNGLRRMCDSPDCKRQQQAAWNRAYAEKKAKVAQPEPAPFEQPGEAARTEPVTE